MPHCIGTCNEYVQLHLYEKVNIMAKPKVTNREGNDSPGNGGRGRYAKGGSILPADWGGVNAELVRDMVACITRTGGAVRFGYTRDGGAYCIGILGDGDPYTIFVSPREDIEEELRAIIEHFDLG